MKLTVQCTHYTQLLWRKHDGLAVRLSVIEVSPLIYADPVHVIFFLSGRYLFLFMGVIAGQGWKLNKQAGSFPASSVATL